MPKLTDTQLVILSAAAARDDYAILPLPGSLKANRGAITASLKSLLKKGLVEEQRAKTGQPCWREEDGICNTLFITPSGLDALNLGAQSNHAPLSRRGKAPSKASIPRTQRSQRKRPKNGGKASLGMAGTPGTKRGLLINLLSTPKGASIHDLQAATGWLPHTVRAALSGLRKQGYVIDRKTYADGNSRYRICRPINPNQPGKEVI